MFVVHALILTVMTTPLTLWCYPPEHRTGRGRKESQKLPIPLPGDDDAFEGFRTKFAIVLSKLEHLPAVMTITQMLQSAPSTPSPASQTSILTSKDLKGDVSRDITETGDIPELPGTPQSGGITHGRITIDALRLMELSERTSAIMRSSEVEELMRRDPLMSVFSTFGRLLNFNVKNKLSIVPHEGQSASVASFARDSESQMTIIPWSISHAGEDNPPVSPGGSNVTGTYNPFEGLFGKSFDGAPSVLYANFVRRVFAESPTDVALYIDRSVGTSGKHHIFFPFFGGPDDRLALKFIVQLCANENVAATVVRVRKTIGNQDAETETVVTGMMEHTKEDAKEQMDSSTVRSQLTVGFILVDAN